MASWRKNSRPSAGLYTTSSDSPSQMGPSPALADRGDGRPRPLPPHAGRPSRLGLGRRPLPSPRVLLPAEGHSVLAGEEFQGASGTGRDPGPGGVLFSGWRPRAETPQSLDASSQFPPPPPVCQVGRCRPRWVEAGERAEGRFATPARVPLAGGRLSGEPRPVGVRAEVLLLEGHQRQGDATGTGSGQLPVGDAWPAPRRPAGGGSSHGGQAPGPLPSPVGAVWVGGVG